MQSVVAQPHVQLLARKSQHLRRGRFVVPRVPKRALNRRALDDSQIDGVEGRDRGFGLQLPPGATASAPRW